MATTCTRSPTLTQSYLRTTQSVYTRYIESVITRQPTISPVAVQTVCLGFSALGNGDITCTSSALTTQFTTLPSRVFTTSFPVATTASFQTTVTSVFYTTWCPRNTKIATVTTPPPTVITTQSSTTLANGAVSVLTRTFTSYVPPTTIYVDYPGAPPNSFNIAAIISGAVGGVFGLIAIILAIWFVHKRRRRWYEVSGNDLSSNPFVGGGGTTNLAYNSSVHTGNSRARFSLGSEFPSGPKPYQYGLIGAGTTLPPSSSSTMLSTHSINYPVNNDAVSPSSSHPMAHFMPSPSTSVPTMPSPWLPVPDPGPGLISPSQSTSADYLPRAGSPVSLSEQTPSRMLQVTNGAPPSTTGRGITVVSSPYSSGYTPGGYNVTNPDADSHTNLLPLVDTKTNVAATSGVDAARDRSGATDVKGRRSSLDLNEGGPSGVWDHANASAPTLRHTRQDSEPPPPAYSL